MGDLAALPDLAEVMNVSHNLLVYRDGRIRDAGRAGDFTPEDIMAQLTGAVAA